MPGLHKVLMGAISPTELVILGGKVQNSISGNGIIYNINSEKAKKIKTNRCSFYTPLNQVDSEREGQFFGLVIDNNGTCNLAIYDLHARQD